MCPFHGLWLQNITSTMVCNTSHIKLKHSSLSSMAITKTTMLLSPILRANIFIVHDVRCSAQKTISRNDPRNLCVVQSACLRPFNFAYCKTEAVRARLAVRVCPQCQEAAAPTYCYCLLVSVRLSLSQWLSLPPPSMPIAGSNPSLTTPKYGTCCGQEDIRVCEGRNVC